MSLHDFAGKVVFLEWFAWWCPYCQAAAPQIETGIPALNNHGVPVVRLSLNLQGGQEAQTQDFINSYGLGQVLNDFTHVVADRFATGGQPIFAVINGVANSPGHQQWELLYSHLGYGELTAPIATFANAINAVGAAAGGPMQPPSILAQPVSRTVAPGEPVSFAVSATGDGAISYQWKRDDTPLAGATAAALDLGAVSAADAGDYTIDVTNAAGTTTSRFARLVVANPVPGRIVNMSVRAPAGVGGEPLIVGLIVNGGAKSMLVRGIGPTLSQYGVSGVLADPMLTVFAGSTAVATNDNWAESGAAPLATAFGGVGAFPLDSASLDAATLLDLNGAYTVHVEDRDGGTGIALVELYDAGTGNSPRLTNVSARNFVGVGDNILVAGFVVSGNEPRTLLIRGVGPGLVQYGVPEVLADPVLEIHTTIQNADSLVAANDDWGDEPNAADATSAVPGAFALGDGSKDAMLLITLPAGAYTAHVLGANDTTGNALVEIYEVP